jgi:hypothetical protein
MLKTVLVIFCAIRLLSGAGRATQLAWWVTWSIRPTDTDVEGVPVRVLYQNWRRVSVIRRSSLPAASTHTGERPEDHGAVFSVDIDLDGDSDNERAVVGVYESAQGDVGRFLLILGRASADKPWTKRALFSLKDPTPFSAIEVRQGILHWVGCFECDDDCAVVRAGSGLRLRC